MQRLAGIVTFTKRFLKTKLDVLSVNKLILERTIL